MMNVSYFQAIEGLAETGEANKLPHTYTNTINLNDSTH